MQSIRKLFHHMFFTCLLNLFTMILGFFPPSTFSASGDILPHLIAAHVVMHSRAKDHKVFEASSMPPPITGRLEATLFREPSLCIVTFFSPSALIFNLDRVSPILTIRASHCLTVQRYSSIHCTLVSLGPVPPTRSRINALIPRPPCL